EHGAGRGRRIAPTLDIHRRKEGLVGFAIVLVDDERALVVRGERLDFVGTGPGWVGEKLVVCVLASVEDVLGIDKAGAGAGKRRKPQRVGLLEGDLHGVVVDRFGVVDWFE